MVYSERFDRALLMASRLHRRQTRKGKPVPVPYVVHLLEVVALVGEVGGSEDEVIAALLHDAVEDQGGAETLASIRREFGDHVADIVDGCSDTDEVPKPPWQQRKERYLAHLAEASHSVLLVSCADKLHNARDLVADFREQGHAVWSRFTASREQTLRYYESLVREFRKRKEVPPRLLDELERTVQVLQELAADN